MSFARPLATTAANPLANPLTGASGGAPSGPLLTNLAAFWNLNEASGDRADSSVNGRTLTDNNTVLSRTGPGGVGTAADFVAANSEYLSRADATPFSLDGDTTIAGWFLIDGTSGVQTVIGMDDGGANREWAVYANGASFQFVVRDSVAGLSTATASGTLAAATWYFFAVQYNETTRQAKAAINNAAFANGSALTNGPAQLSASLHLGRLASLYQDGASAAIGYWDELLTADQLTFLYNSGAAARLYSDVAAYTG